MLMSIPQSSVQLNAWAVRVLSQIWSVLPEGHPLPADVWQRRHRGIVALLWLHVVGIAAFGILRGYEPLHLLADVALIAVAAVGAERGSRRVRALIASVGLLTSSAVLVHLSGGYIETHFHFFVMIILITLYQDWIPFLCGIGFVVIHHGAFGGLAPELVYNHPDAWANPWKWAVIHGAFVLAASVASIVSWRLSEMAHARAQLTLDSAGDGICGLDLTGRITFANPAAGRLLGWSSADLVGRPIHTVLSPPSSHRGDLWCPPARRWDEIVEGTDPGPQEEVFHRRDGTPLPVEATHTPIYERGRRVGAVIAFQDITDRARAAAEIRRLNAELEQRVRDRTAQLEAANRTLADEITERKALEEQLTHQAFHDPLTGLANRALFHERLTHALARAQRRIEPMAVLFLDLDNFKTINDSLGHAAGDAVLKTVAERIRACVRAADTTARFGGDEFAILLEDLQDEGEAAVVAGRIIAEVGGPFLVQDTEVAIATSIGLVISAGRQEDAGVLLRSADIAMYAAKRRGKGRVVLFEPEMQAEVMERLQLEGELRRVLERGELFLEYQPIVDLTTGAMTGLEALVRWQHPSRGRVPPVDFIPLAEETGLILPIGRWVLAEACREASTWQSAHPNHPPLTVSVNVSPRQIEQGGLVEQVADILRDSGLEPQRLTLEITEGSLMQRSAATIEMLHALKDLGVQLAIDDFGTGYSSLSYLQDLPIDILKIDKSFVDHVAERGPEPPVAQAIIQLGRTLGLRTVAEGIETVQQANQLQDLACDAGQGYHFARPLSQVQLGSLLRNRRSPDEALASGDRHEGAGRHKDAVA